MKGHAKLHQILFFSRGIFFYRGSKVSNGSLTAKASDEAKTVHLSSSSLKRGDKTGKLRAECL